MATSLYPMVRKPATLPDEVLMLPSTSSVAPRFYQDFTKGTEIDGRLVDYLTQLMKQHELCRSMLLLTLQNCSSWLQLWQPMTLSEKASACSLANQLFGDLSLPYPEMGLASVGVIFHRANSIRGPVLARISLGVDPQSIRSRCVHCDDSFLVIDAIDPDVAIKITVPLPSNSNHHSYKSLQDFKKRKILKKGVVEHNWSKIAYHLKGWSHKPTIRKCSFCCGKPNSRNKAGLAGGDEAEEEEEEEEEEKEERNGYAQLDQDDEFEPFPLSYAVSEVVHSSSCKKDEVDARESDEDSHFEAFPDDQAHWSDQLIILNKS